jgi:anti-sigma factor RsiW
MSEARHEKMATELRKAAPTAPESLRERVRGLREPHAGRAWRLRPALVAATAIVVAVGISAATIGGLTGSTAPKQKSLVVREFAGAITVTP